MSKKVLSVLLALGLAVSSVACSRSNSEDRENKKPRATTTAEESESVDREEEANKTEETETTPTTTTSDEIGTTAGTTTAAADETDTSSAPTPDPNLEVAEEGPIRELEPESLDDVENITYLEAVPEDTTELTEGPKQYHYCMATVYVSFPGSNTHEGGVFLISNIRCILSGGPSPRDDMYYWTIDDESALDKAITQYCDENNITKSDLGYIANSNNWVVQSISYEYYSSLRYTSFDTWTRHDEDGDVYSMGDSIDA